MTQPDRETSKRRTSGMYAKGAARREVLIDTAAELLADHPLDSISLKIIAEKAGFPIGSAYHFYTNANEVFSALAARFADELIEAVAAPYTGPSTHSWQALFEKAVDRAVAIYEANPAYRHLIIGNKAPPDIKLADRENDERAGEVFVEVICRHFEFPDFPNRNQVFFHAIEITDLFLSLSMIYNGAINEDMVVEAKRAAIAYLRTYLPDVLTPRKPVVAE